MKTIRNFFAVLLAVFAVIAGFACPQEAMATNLAAKNLDCQSILERWAANPKSVPKRLVDECKAQQAAQPAAAPVAPPPAPVAADPCIGPSAASSVHCWGPWATLAPAAAAAANLPKLPEGVDDCDSLRQLADRCLPRLVEAELPLGSCAPGTPCGFATVVSGVTSNAPSDSTQIKRFDFAPDASHFTVDPHGSGEITSVNGMTATSFPTPPPYEGVRALGQSGDQQSRIVARIITEGEGGIVQAADVWTNGNRSTGAANSGYFAWGYSASQATLDSLNGGNVSLSFQGPMSVDNSTSAAMTLNFGSHPTWTGTWTNPGWQFGAGGTVKGVDLISVPAQFTPNVQAGSYVQGILLGSAGQHGIAHAIDVTLADTGHIKDVGLLHEVISGPESAIRHP